MALTGSTYICLFRKNITVVGYILYSTLLPFAVGKETLNWSAFEASIDMVLPTSKLVWT